MRILIATVSTPFVRGGAELHAEGLRDALCAAGHETEIIAIPFKWYPPERILDQMLACRLLDVTESEGIPVDRVIGLKFPAYLIPHPSKVLWILHQHRPAYDLWDHELGDLIRFPNGSEVRDAIRHADCTLIPEAQAVFANSGNVAHRLNRYCGIEAEPLYHPPPSAEAYYSAPADDYFFFPSRMNPTKRQHLVVEALAFTRSPVRVRFASAADNGAYWHQLRETVERHSLGCRAEFLGAIGEQEKRDLFAHACGVIYPPVDEDYGYVTLEAMLACKPVITCTDSGGPLELVHPGQTGLVVEPTPQEIARAMDQIWEDRMLASRMGEAGRDRYASLRINWTTVVERLLA